MKKFAKKSFILLLIILTMSLFCLLNTINAASNKAFNVSSRDKFLGSHYKNVVMVNDEFQVWEDPYDNAELHKYGLAINDVLSGNNQFEQILQNRSISYSIDNSSSETAFIYYARFEYQISSLYIDGYSNDFDRLKLAITLNYNGSIFTWTSNMYYRYYSKI